ncbi:MAG: hypothetical protein AAGD92_02795 [Pseudomonadota bacterium]
MTVLIISLCLIVGAVAALLSMRPNFVPEMTANLKRAETVKKFSPRNTLFIIGPAVNHSACRMQRRLLKPAIPALISEDVEVIELYGLDTPRKNGELIEWLDPALLRHALAAESGFYVIYVDPEGKTRFRSEAPMVTSDILDRARITIQRANSPERSGKSKVLRRLRAA